MTPNIAVTEDIAACLALRIAVFVDEQGVPMDEEIDDLDGAAVHLLATQNGQPVATARLLHSGSTGKIGRICVLKSHRKTGLGTALMDAAIAYFKGENGLDRLYLSAQTHAIDFYEGFGFVAEGAVYDDAGIPHRDMVRAL